MRITVYGPGCPKCVKTEEVARQAVQQLGIDAEVVKVKDIAEMAKAGVLMTPALAVDGRVAIKGRVPEVSEVVSLITTTLEGK